MPGLLYTIDLVLCGESKEALGALMGRFVEVCGRIRMKVIAGKRKERGGIGVGCNYSMRGRLLGRGFG